jgi:hypothetical protein
VASLAPEPERAALSGAPVGTLAPEAIDRLQALALDFILCFMDGPAARASHRVAAPRNLAIRTRRLGQLSRSTGGFWEVFDGCAASAVLLVRVSPDPDVVEVLREGVLRTQPLSVRKNRQQLLGRFTHWPAQICREISPAEPACRRAGARAAGASTRRADQTASRRVAARVARWADRPARGVHRAALVIRHDQWNIGIVDQPIEQFLSAECAGKDPMAARDPARGVARDPFGTLRGGTPVILCEHFSYRDNVGYIVAIDAAGERVAEGDEGAPDGRLQMGPARSVHLSYPYLFEDGRQVVLRAGEQRGGGNRRVRGPAIPGPLDQAMDARRRPRLRRCDRVSIRGSVVVGSLRGCPQRARTASCISGLPRSSRGHGRPHPGNPVKIDVRSARAGWGSILGRWHLVPTRAGTARTPTVRGWCSTAYWC